MPIPHRWDLDPQSAITLQKELASQIDTQTPLDFTALQTVAGVDVSVKEKVSQAAIVVLRLDTLQVIESATAQLPTPFPYIPGLLSFREGQVILAAHEKIKTAPDVYIFDGAGIAHPRRLGIAAHLGLWLQAPTLGCAKTWLCGTYSEPGAKHGDFAPLMEGQTQIGLVLRTKDQVKPIYLSVGHRATLQSARDLILCCTTRYRLPEPIRAAHHTAAL
jgi:deoxyribonuclease V